MDTTEFLRSQEEVQVFGTKGHPLQSLFHKG
jgi:hypothetical protein